MLDLLEVPIFRRGWKYRRYDGSMTSTERNDAIIEFTDDPEISIMLISMKAGNSGLNLVAASQIILFGMLRVSLGSLGVILTFPLEILAIIHLSNPRQLTAPTALASRNQLLYTNSAPREQSRTRYWSCKVKRWR